MVPECLINIFENTLYEEITSFLITSLNCKSNFACRTETYQRLACVL